VHRKEVDQALDFSELVDGDLLVHLQHGICRFCSLGKIEQQGKTEEAISVEFADGILLHIPLQESHLLSRYIGLKKAKPKLAKLGGKSWAKTREAAEIAAIDLAADLLRLQASRDSERGFSFSPDDKWQKEFEDSFPYSETPDQLRSIVEVKEDMESDKPMDRLICGDVGYGKTEVAMRAAFKAMMDGKQVALLAPTTILCQQHMESFLSRMADFPVVIEMLSRFRTPAQQKKTLQGIQSGSVDMLIGTHRMFSDGLTFKDLGLLIIDEEQRFGVDHKEKLKRLKANVDVLTLSATPIPRTLYFAMVGVRSFSTIETAPVNRRPIRTEVVRKSDDVLKKAIQLELHRGGQVFYLYNRVKTIHVVAKKLQKLMPGLRVAVGHGQMAEAQLEQVMVDFISGKYDLLLCTTIIESGLDIPNCNTIIIEEADKFGLSQLYQLRGRVGRFTRQAYAYLLVNPSLPIKDKAKKRLSALRATSSMGAGFKIALRDLELRGAGNLLGSEQSGHIAGVGFEVYCRLLRESVSRLKGDEIALRPHAVVRLDFLHTDESIPEDSASLNMASCLPESYMNEPRLRIDFYRKIAAVMEIESLNDLRSELRDRFGPLPSSVEALFMEVEIKCLAQESGFDLISTKGRELQCRYVRRSSKEGIKYLRKLGNLPCLNEKQPLLKLKEIIRFLKLHIHGNT
jgi:transcription-repair coupling factor (superfamily II helicase)